MNKKNYLALILIVLAAFSSSNAFAVEKTIEEPDEDAVNFQYQTVTTPEGLNFRVPEDMPIEKRNGILAPIPFDEYMYGKFKRMDLRLKGMEAKLENIEKILIKLSEEKAKASLKG